MTARTPDPTSLFALDTGAPRAAMIGKRYDNVLPVPVGDIAARSRD
jgi:hypothetical protein